MLHLIALCVTRTCEGRYGLEMSTPVPFSSISLASRIPVQTLTRVLECHGTLIGLTHRLRVSIEKCALRPYHHRRILKSAIVRFLLIRFSFNHFASILLPKNPDYLNCPSIR